jgi:hypothetical protein
MVKFALQSRKFSLLQNYMNFEGVNIDANCSLATSSASTQIVRSLDASALQEYKAEVNVKTSTSVQKSYSV